MKTYEQGLLDAHKEISDVIKYKLPYESSGYIKGMLDAARIVLVMLTNEVNENGGC